jgi:hypothetical protein
MFIINGAHKCSGGRKDFIDENENGLFRGKLDTLANDIAKLSNRQIGGD